MRTFRPWLAGITVAGFAVRVLYTFTISPALLRVGDDSFYYYASNLIAQGHGYVDPFKYLFSGHLDPTAAHPPLWPFVLSAVSMFTAPAAGVGTLTGAAVDAHRVVGCLFGAGTVFLIGLLGRRIGGWRVGLLAAALAAVYPHFITLDGYLMSEPLYGALVVGLLIVAYDFAARPGRARAIALGGLVGLAALTRQEALLFVPVLVIPLTLRSRTDRGALCGLAVLATILVIAPWTLRNYVTYHRIVPVATTTGTVLAGANCPSTYYGDNLGSWQERCIGAVSSQTYNEAAVASQHASQGINYAERHAARAVLIAGIRLLRIWSLYAPNDQAIGNRSVLWVGTALYWCLLVAAIAGAVMLRRAGRGLLIVASAPIVTCIAAVVGDALDRLRYGAEVPLIALAAWTLVALYQRHAPLHVGAAIRKAVIAPRYGSVPER